MRRVLVLDTTLRDGEQAPDVHLGLQQKLAIARQLERLGVDVVEAGFPATSPGEAEAVAAIAEQVRGVAVKAIARCRKEDIDIACRALADAVRPQLGLFISTSALHMQHKLHMEPQAILDAVSESVLYARRLGFAVSFAAEDATRSDVDFLLQVLETAAGSGATTLILPDTVGYATPDEYAALVRRVRTRLPLLCTIATHCHDDLGLAVANTLAGVEAGAQMVEVTVGGIGERAGNAALEEVVMALQVRADRYGAETGVHGRELMATAELVHQSAGRTVPPGKAVIGENAFRHKSGLHQDGVLQARQTYEIMAPEAVGARGDIVLGKHSGRRAFHSHLRRLGFDLDEASLRLAFTRFKQVCDQGCEVGDDLLRQIARTAVQAATGMESPD